MSGPHLALWPDLLIRCSTCISETAAGRPVALGRLCERPGELETPWHQAWGSAVRMQAAWMRRKQGKEE